MHTNQIYAGKGSYTSFTEQTAKKANQITSTADGQSKDLAKLFVTVNSFLSSEDSKKTVFALNTVLEHWIKTEYKGYVRDGLCDEDMKLWDTVIDNILNTVSLITDLETYVDNIYHNKANE